MHQCLTPDAYCLLMHIAFPLQAVVKEKMRQTFAYRQKMVLDPVKSSEIFTEYPRFLDIAQYNIYLFVSTYSILCTDEQNFRLMLPLQSYWRSGLLFTSRKLLNKAVALNRQASFKTLFKMPNPHWK